MVNGPDAAPAIERDFARVLVVEILELLAIGSLVILAPVFYVMTKNSEAAPAWLLSAYVALILSCALVPAFEVRRRGGNARRFVVSLGPTVREGGLVNGALVVRFENGVFLSIGKGGFLPASGPWMVFERVGALDGTSTPADLDLYRRCRRMTLGIAAIRAPRELRDNHPLMRSLKGLFGSRLVGPIVSFRDREVGRKDAREGVFREVEIDVLSPEWSREGALVAAAIDEVGRLLDAAMTLAREEPIVFGLGTLRPPPK